MNYFRNLGYQEYKLKLGIKRFIPINQELSLQALGSAKDAHKGQSRKEGGPYIIHSIRVVNTLIYDLGITREEMVNAGLLHDVVEDSNVTIDVIEHEFGKYVSTLVSQLTRNENESRRDKFKKTIQAPLDVRILKSCDWLDNLRSKQLVRSIVKDWQTQMEEAQDMYIPLASSTGQQYLIEEMQRAYDAVIALT